ncbi:MAG: aminopeptidase [Elusimicrobia bacterium GWC2_51_8]|nr:MAG: aminopeptidase [Elusimicrobia bacterium GWA2_51_34]OGR58218.1 MAG: aminopeptidase [Elusimicrobia bacterium GWC2_51_8]OGR85685.1 MAG: aminopeptidase [Elusimicrobia bacterium GWF2_52_66]HAF95468.1 aminopeptidase [Elusimicrobiota bacterium]HCE98130.1 aminopeptidase [Elusimicrobiota bacterium]
MKKKSKTSKKIKLAYLNKNGYGKLPKTELKNLEQLNRLYLEFITKVKTERDAHDEAVELLETAGFRDLRKFEKDNIRLTAGDRVYKSCSGKTLMAVIIGKKPLETGMHIVGAHTDSPRIDVKQNPLYEKGDMAFLDTHYYGGIKKYQWVTIPLALHGVFIKPDGKKIKVSVGEDPSEPVLCITDLLPHLAQDQMKKTLAEGIKGEHLDAIVGSIPAGGTALKEKIKHNTLKLLNEKYGITEEDFLSAELELVPAAKPREAGLDRSMVLGYGQDDRVCAYTGLKAMIDLKGVPQYTSCVLLCDKEEIGSVGATGMASNFFENTAAELLNLTSKVYSELSLKRALCNSWMLSADVNSLFDPMYPDVSEKKNTAFMNHGLCVTKYTGARGKSGSSDANAEFLAEIRRIFAKAGVIWQTGELGKVDQGGGGTIAWLMARYGMQVVDCGVGLLSMHAPMELAGKLDIYMAYKGYLAFLKDGRK